MAKGATPSAYNPNKEPASFSVNAHGSSMKELQRKLSGAFKAVKPRKRGRR